MTQVKCRAMGGKGMTQAAWKYAKKYALFQENKRKHWSKLDEDREAEKKKVTLPKLKWMGEK
jgi:hypothetical protein